jgi:hypothetical protein
MKNKKTISYLAVFQSNKKKTMQGRRSVYTFPPPAAEGTHRGMGGARTEGRYSATLPFAYSIRPFFRMASIFHSHHYECVMLRIMHKKMP